MDPGQFSLRYKHGNPELAPEPTYSIPVSNFRILIQEPKFSSTDDFFNLLRTLGNDYNTHIRVQKSITRLNSQLVARLNREAHVQTTPSQPSGGATSSSLTTPPRSHKNSRARERSCNYIEPHWYPPPTWSTNYCVRVRACWGNHHHSCLLGLKSTTSSVPPFWFLVWSTFLGGIFILVILLP